jgi:hypothetical protein
MLGCTGSGVHPAIVLAYARAFALSMTRKPSAQLDRRRQLSLLVEGGADRSGTGLGDDEHPQSMAMDATAGKRWVARLYGGKDIIIYMKHSWMYGPHRRRPLVREYNDFNALILLFRRLSSFRKNDRGGRAVGCDRVAPAVSGDHRQHEGASMRQDHRRVDAAPDAAERGDAAASPQGRLACPIHHAETGLPTKHRTRLIWAPVSSQSRFGECWLSGCRDVA